jgi:hypothetical protein
MFIVCTGAVVFACSAVDDVDTHERLGQAASALSTEVCLGGADTPALLPKWTAVYNGRFDARTVISGTVQNTDVVDVPIRIDVRMAGGDARVISTTLWQGTLARGATQTVSLALNQLPIRSYVIASAAEIVATATGAPRRGDTIYSAPLYATYSPSNSTFTLSGDTPPQTQTISAPSSFNDAVMQLTNRVQPWTRRTTGRRSTTERSSPSRSCRPTARTRSWMRSG